MKPTTYTYCLISDRNVLHFACTSRKQLAANCKGMKLEYVDQWGAFHPLTSYKIEKYLKPDISYSGKVYPQVIVARTPSGQALKLISMPGNEAFNQVQFDSSITETHE